MEWKQDMTILDEALKRGATTISEHESKLFLAEQGIPVTRECIKQSEEGVLAAAETMGYPVVLKASGDELSHKTELNLIELDLRNEDEVRQAYRRLISRPDIPLRDVLVQQMIKGDRELVAGLTRDEQFGPCVMFGLGGIFTEILEDIVFRVAPLTRADAMEMMDAIRARKILGPVRGKPPIDRDRLGDILITLGEIGLRFQTIREIDINPIKILDGNPVAVDALVVLSTE
jgi:succinyl-CoA synthetase beta subunit